MQCLRDLSFFCKHDSSVYVTSPNTQADRLRRMRGIGEQENKKKPSHVSADDLTDGFILDKDDRRLLSYKVG